MRGGAGRAGLVAIVLLTSGGALLAQMTPRPDSRIASYPTAPMLQPPLTIRFEPAWERDIPGERIVEIAATGGRIRALTAQGRLTLWDAGSGEPSGDAERLDADASLAAAPGGQSRRFALAGDAWLESRDGRSGKVRWHARLLTGAGTPPLIVTTAPGGKSRQKRETLLIVGTLDGDIVARREDNGHLAWTSRAAGRLTRPFSVWMAPGGVADGEPDRTRLLVAALGSRRLEAFRALDGAAAGSLQLEPDSAVILAGPIVVESGGELRCVLAWSPWVGAGSRLLSLRLL